MSLSSLVLFFTIYAFIGWLLETIYCSIPARKFVYRGFLKGPTCPIYGFGALAILLILDPFSNSPVLVFLFGVIITSGLEYIVSALLETLFHKSWWDYSHKKFNINGRICLLNSLMWGVLSLGLVYWVHPLITGLVDRIPPRATLGIAGAIVALYALDLVLSVKETLHFNRDLLQLTKLSALVDAKKDEIKLALGTFREEQKQLLDEELANLVSSRDEKQTAFLHSSRRIQGAFPRMKLHQKDKLSLRNRLENYLLNR